jgi:flagellin
MKIHFGTGNSSAEDYYYVKIGTATASALGVGNSAAVGAGYTISTQSAAQVALEAIDSAIVTKDNIRANLGALANRLANTVSNLSIQAENLQSAESRISDVDVATEMTEFTRNQVLTQAAVAMLAQANTLPQLALRLLGG